MIKNYDNKLSFLKLNGDLKVFDMMYNYQIFAKLYN